MKIKEILTGLNYRLESLRVSEAVLKKEPETFYTQITDTQARIDELESVYNWIKENSDED